MNREQKKTMVGELQQRLQQAQLAVLASPKGLTVAQVTALRRSLREAGGELKVAKNTLARIAVKETPFAGLDALLEGQNGLVFAYRDPVAIAKIVVKFADAHAHFKVRGGILEGGPITAEEVENLAKLPSREVILAQLLGLLQAPASRLLRTIQEPGASLARLLEQLRLQREAAGENS